MFGHAEKEVLTGGDGGGVCVQVITYAKFGDHLLDDEEDFRRMTNDVKELCAKFYEFDLSSPTSG